MVHQYLGTATWRRTALVLFLALSPSLDTVAENAQSRTLTDSAGRHVTIPSKIDRVFVAGPPSAVVLYTLAPEKLLGWTRALSDEEKAFMPERYASLPVLGRLTGRNIEAVVREVAALHPDLILDVGDVDGRYATLADRVQQQTGVPYVLLDGRLPNTAELYHRLGDVLGVSAKAAGLAAYAERTMADLKTRTAAVAAERRPRIFYTRDPDGTQTSPVGSITGEIFDLAGGINVAGGTTGAVTFDQIRRWDPDAILTSNPDFSRRALTDPQWQGLRAVREGRVYLAPAEPFGWIDEPPGVNRLIGLRWLSTVLYQVPGHNELRDIVLDFYARFYHVRPTEQQVSHILKSVP